MISPRNFPLSDVLSILTGILFSKDYFGITELVERLTGRAVSLKTIVDLRDKVAPIGRLPILAQYPKLVKFTRLEELDDLRSIVFDFNNPHYDERKMEWLEKTECEVGMTKLSFEVPFIYDLAYLILKTMIAGETRLESIQQHPNLDGYAGLAVSCCIKDMMEQGLIEDGSSGLLLKTSSSVYRHGR